MSAPDLNGVRGFVFDLDGTLVQRAADSYEVIPGAPEVLEKLHATGRPFVIFTNASHIWPETIAAELRDDGLPVGDDEVLTPICSAMTFLGRRHPGQRVYAFATDAVLDRLAKGGVDVVSDEEAGSADAVFVATPQQFDLAVLDRCAHAIDRGARLFTASFVPAYSGANGKIFSKGSMVAAALQKATGVRPTILGKPSRAAVAEIVDRMGVPSRELAIVGDDVKLEIALAHIGHSRAILVRSGISGSLDLSRLPKAHRPDAVIDGVDDLLAAL